MNGWIGWSGFKLCFDIAFVTSFQRRKSTMSSGRKPIGSCLPFIISIRRPGLCVALALLVWLWSHALTAVTGVSGCKDHGIILGTIVGEADGFI